MVLTKTELVDSLKNENRILLHLAGKVDRAKLDYRPSAKQRSTLELLPYLSFIGPAILDAGRTGKFDGEAWTKADRQLPIETSTRRSRQSQHTLAPTTPNYPMSRTTTCGWRSMASATDARADRSSSIRSSPPAPPTVHNCFCT